MRVCPLTVKQNEAYQYFLKCYPNACARPKHISFAMCERLVLGGLLEKYNKGDISAWGKRYWRVIRTPEIVIKNVGEAAKKK